MVPVKLAPHSGMLMDVHCGDRTTFLFTSYQRAKKVHLCCARPGHFHLFEGEDDERLTPFGALRKRCSIKGRRELNNSSAIADLAIQLQEALQEFCMFL